MDSWTAREREVRKSVDNVSLPESEGHRERLITAEQVGIAACEDCCLRGSLKGKTVTAASVGVWEDTERVHGPAHHPTWKCEGKTLGPRVTVLYVDVDTLQDDRTVFFCSKQVYCTSSAEWSQKIENTKVYEIETKLSQSFINL